MIRSKPTGKSAPTPRKITSAGFCYDVVFSFVALVLTVITLKAARTAESVQAKHEARGTETPAWAGWTALSCLLLLFALWYFFNVFFNIYNKQVLKAMSVPFSMTLMQFFIGSLIVAMVWMSKAHPFYKPSRSELYKIVPLALLHTLGNLFTNISLNAVAVSFTHTIKASEPFFAVVMSWIFLASPPTLLVVGSLVPVVGGVTLASFTEATFNWIGLSTALASNLTFQTRNVVSKKLMIKKGKPTKKLSDEPEEATLDNINLFSYMTLMSFAMLLPVSLWMEGMPWLPSVMAASFPTVDPIQMVAKAAFAGFFFHSYQQVSYLILQRVHPVTHAVGNCVKRVAVIVISILFFANPVGLLNALGIGVAMCGVLVYSVVKKLEAQWEKAKKKLKLLSGSSEDMANYNACSTKGEYLPLKIGEKKPEIFSA